tara:strand:- start:279 stop:953 length:675 start_codon:yes stop_codon:yes gene_type:complete
LVLLNFSLSGRYKKAAAATVQRIVAENNASDTDWNTELLGGSQRPHVAELTCRCNFLYFILSNSNVMVTTKHIDALWRCMATEALTVMERHQLFSWLVSVCGTAKTWLIPADVSEYVFVEKLSQMPVESVDFNALCCWMRYFPYVNGLKKNVEQWDEASQCFVVHDLEGLLELRFLWDLVFDSPYQDVSSEASLYLRYVHQQLAPALHKQRIRHVPWMVLTFWF